MKKQIIFQGQKYNWDGKYYSPSGGYTNGKKRLHQSVWEYHNGKIPKGYQIHHKDKDKTNNEIDNLELVETNKHLSEHAKENWKDPEFRARGEKHLDNVRDLTKEWHASEEGHKWHKEHGIKAMKNRKPIERECHFCHKIFKTKQYSIKVKYCHQNCRAKAYRRIAKGLKPDAKIS